ncbi:polyadenylate-binding protein-interacting protein 3-like isoform X2 [Euphorbia lathyris]|uniref:polyadenylate-binding protein-interacting protein 3-like isoform X2 n=1 Tax=Euphorbia lathyris TaxID=212925 RepID=UPI003313F6C6
MSLQQAAQSKSYNNGFGRRRAEKDGGTRLDNKLQSGKPNLNRSGSSMVGGKVGVHESPARDRLIYLSACLIGQTVEVHLKNGSILSGIFHTTNIEKEFAISLEMARTIKDVSFRGQRTELSKAPTKFMIVPGKDIVQVLAKDVCVTADGIANEVQHEKQQEILIDSYISQTRNSEVERELAPWVPDEDDPQCPELENIFDGQWNRGWDQFETNATLFGVKSTFDEELYTTKLEKGPQMRELEKQALRIAKEIEGEDTKDLHLAEERGIHLDETFDIDEETRFSSVYRGIPVDDSGYDETEDIMLDSRNSETFGDAPMGDQVLSTSYVDETHCSQSSAIADFDRSGSYEQARQLASELPPKNLFTSDSKSRIQEKLYNEQEANEDIKGCVNEQTVEDAQLRTCEDSWSSSDIKKDGSDKGRLSPDATAYAPSSNVSLSSHEKTSSSAELSEGAPSGKGEVQSVNLRGRPGSSTSSASDCIGVPSVANGRGLSPSSSVGSLSSEKSTLNPHAKEFKLNPNAKSFTPIQTPVRPPSPVSDGSFYVPPNVPALPHLHGMQMGYGIGPSFTGHQPVIFNSQVASMQTQQAYFHPGGPQYGQQVLVSHPRQVMYYPPEMQYKGREF